MDPPRIERGYPRCKRGILPLDYGPMFTWERRLRGDFNRRLQTTDPIFIIGWGIPTLGKFYAAKQTAKNVKIKLY